jgi:hypothetical protein
VADRVRFVPFVPEDEMFRLVASADVSVIPTEPNSVGNEFGLPNKFFESMMAGLPLVASATPAVKPILERVKAGLLYPAEMPQDPLVLPPPLAFTFRGERYAGRLETILPPSGAPAKGPGARRARVEALLAEEAAVFERLVADAPEQWWAVFFPIWPDLALESRR